MDEKNLLGNRVERGIEKLMPKTAARMKAKEDCGCNKRKEKLNDFHKKLLGEK